MANEKPKHILCAVRSRPGGEETVERAIELALETGAKLTFFQVIDSRFLDRFSPRSSSRKAAHRELADMAEFTMSLIAEQARKQGVTETDYIVRQGEVRQELFALVVEIDADVLVMGRPKAGPGQRAFANNERDELIAELEQLGVIVDT